MKNTSIKTLLLIIPFMVAFNPLFADQIKKPMLPVFSYQFDPEKVLREYPLGLISEQVAFSHHGGPVRKLTLPNGNQGWLYSTGEQAGVPAFYILQFSRAGTVIDVMHKSLHYKNGHLALQYQFVQGLTPELKITGSGKAENYLFKNN